MGNLPFSRTATYNPSDPVPSTIIDEIQDVLVAAERAKMLFLTSALGSVSNTPTPTRPEFGADDGAIPSTLWAYCVSPGTAFLRQGASQRQVQMAPGILLQSDGANNALLAYRFNGTEVFPDLSNGDATNARVDLLQMKITFDPALGPSVTLGTKNGTAAATPVIPDPDAGFVPVGFSVTGQTYSGGVNSLRFALTTNVNAIAQVCDVRMPIGVRAYTVEPLLFNLETAWALQQTNIYVQSSSATNAMYCRCPTRVGRIVAVDIDRAAPPSGTVTLGRGTWAGGVSIGSTVFPSRSFGTYNGYLFGTVARSRRVDFEGSYAPGGTIPNITQSAVNKIGVPFWTSGLETPQADTTALAGHVWSYLKILNAASGQQHGSITWYVASGL